jgi:hypothetical protein
MALLSRSKVVGTASITALVLLAGSMAIAHATGFDGSPGCGPSGSPSAGPSVNVGPSDFPSGSPSGSPGPGPCPSGSPSGSSESPSDNPSSSPSEPPPDPFHGVLDGVLTTTSGGPLAHASLSAQMMPFGPIPQAYTATTDAAGHYRIRAMKPGRYLVSIEVPGTSLIQYLHRKRTIETANLVTITGGKVTAGNDRELGTGILAGRLLDRAGHPVHANVFASDTTHNVSVFAQTDNAGAFTIPLFAGSYHVQFTYGSGVTQYAPGQLDYARAKAYPVRYGQTTVLDETTVPTGSVTGRILNDNGTPAANATVELSSLTVSQKLATRTRADGTYRMDLVPADKYTAQVISSDFTRDQWIPHTVQERAATVLSLQPDQTATLDDRFLPTGTLRLTAKNSAGTPVSSFCAFVPDGDRGFGNCTQNGTLTFTGVPTGRYDVRVSTSQDTLLNTTVPDVTVATGGSTATATLPAAGVIQTSTLDAKTHQPVAGVCVVAVTLDGSLPAGRGCSDGTGNARLGGLAPGTYTLLALPSDGRHGSQWVGPNGGTGSQYSARTVAAKAGQVTSTPAVQLDGAGTFTGTVTDAVSGKGIPFVCVDTTPAGADFSGGGPCLGTRTDASGHYTLTGVGPYKWPVQFASVEDARYAWQWSGGVASRKQASTAAVKVGGSTTVDAHLTRGTTVSGTILGTNGAPLRAQVMFRNTGTGDLTGFPAGAGSYTVALLPQTVRVWFLDGRQPARPVAYPNQVVVGTKAVTLNLTGL